MDFYGQVWEAANRVRGWYKIVIEAKAKTGVITYCGLVSVLSPPTARDQEVLLRSIQEGCNEQYVLILKFSQDLSLFKPN